jgi:hypothetical protein
MEKAQAPAPYSIFVSTAALHHPFKPRVGSGSNGSGPESIASPRRPVRKRPPCGSKRGRGRLGSSTTALPIGDPHASQKRASASTDAPQAKQSMGMSGSEQSDGAHPDCVKTPRGKNAPGILRLVVTLRAKKRKNSSSARHYDQISFRFHTAWVSNGLSRCTNGRPAPATAFSTLVKRICSPPRRTAVGPVRCR